MKRVMMCLWATFSIGLFNSGVHAATVGVSVQNFSFSPQNITVNVGDTVKWTNNGGTHTVTSGSGCSSNGVWASGTMSTGQTFSRVFNAAGTYPYFCEFHCSSGMTGTVTVTGTTPVTFTLSLTKSGTGSGTVTADTGTISWSGSAGTVGYASGTTVTLTAAADAGSTFSSWSGCAAASGNTCTVSMTAAKSVTAAFTLNPVAPAYPNDLDGDGKADILFHNKSTGDVSLWIMNGAAHTGTVSIGKVPDTDWEPVGMGDFNGDGRNDILWHNKVTGEVYIWYMDGVQANQGGVSVETVADLNWEPVGVGEFNGDGKPDILWHNRSTGDVYLWTMNGAVHSGTVNIGNVADTRWTPVGVADYNKDGSVDILWHHKTGGDVYVWFMDGVNASKGGNLIATVTDTDWIPVGTGDYNGDGNPDILWQHQATGEVYIWYMNETSHTGDKSVETVSDANLKVAAVGYKTRTATSDFNLDGNPDILWLNRSTGDVYLWYLNGAVHRGSVSIEKGVPTEWKIAGTGDFNKDGNPDILWLNQNTGDVYLWYLNGAVHRGSVSIEKGVSTDWRIAGIGDFNKDGNPDILWHNKLTGEVSLWLMNGATHTSSVSIGKVSDTNWIPVGVADYNGDGSVDILWHNKATGEVYLWFMDGVSAGKGEVRVGAVPDVNWIPVGTGDYNGDGKPDILWQNQATGEVYIWYMDGPSASLGGVSVETVADTNWKVAGM